MHNLTGNDFLSGIVRDLKMEHKELLYFLSLQIKLYQHLIQKRDAQTPLTLREKEFIELYEDAMNHQSKTGTRVKRQNKFPKRKKATDDAIALFGDREASGVVLLKGYDAYYDGYEENGKAVPG